jgi:hypothetical protein
MHTNIPIAIKATFKYYHSIMAANPQQTEAVKMISDWSKWIATIETASIAVIGSFFSKTGIGFSVAISLSLAVGAFIISIVATSCVLFSLRATIQDIKDGEKARDRVAPILGFRPRLKSIVMFKFSVFFLGILLFAIGVILLLFSRSG